MSPLFKNRFQYAFFTGLWAEWLTVLLLWFKGYAILHRRFKTVWGEIDVVARKHHTFVFVEVKKRQSLTQALESVKPLQRSRIQRAALHFLQRDAPFLRSYQTRFDVVCWQPWQWPVHITHAWSLES